MEQAHAKKGGEVKPLLFRDCVSIWTNYGSSEKKQEIGGLVGARIVVCATRNKPNLENMSLSASESKRENYALVIKHGKTNLQSVVLFGVHMGESGEIALVPLLQLLCATTNIASFMQDQYGFTWGGYSQHLHTQNSASP